VRLLIQREIFVSLAYSANKFAVTGANKFANTSQTSSSKNIIQMRFLLVSKKEIRLKIKRYKSVFTLRNSSFIIYHSSLILLFLFGCKNREPRTINSAFIHWKSHLELTAFERNYCKELDAKTLYLRFFDVDINAGNKLPEPIAESSFNANDLTHFAKIIPTVFITNRSLINVKDTAIDSLSALIVNKLAFYTEGSSFENKIEEILIDCDWTEKTCDKFFHLIKKLKRISNKKITATIRLHQIKFKEKTGIPPADKGLLMAYNTGDLSDPQTTNSILDIEVLKSYIGNLDNYPLDLDVALPIFSWGIVKRDGQAVQLISNFAKDFFFKKTPQKGFYTEGSPSEKKVDNNIEILKNGYYNGIYLYADDVIKLEEVSPENLKTAAQLLSQHIHNQRVTVSFFSLDSVNLKRYNSQELRGIVEGFR
jgi:hypothetical protein